MPTPKRPSSAATQLFADTSAQGQQFAGPPGDSDEYYAFLSKADLDPETNLWDLMLEVVNRRWLDNALSQPVDVAAPLTGVPALIFHAPKLNQAVVLKTLGVTDTDFIAEGSWYQVTLSKSAGNLEDPSLFTGDLYDPDIDMLPSS